MSALQVQIGGRTVNVQVYSSGVARALEAIRESAASEAAAAASQTAAAASAAAAATSEANAAATLAGAALKANNLSDLANAAMARTNLGLGSIATQSAASVAITGGSITGITDLAVADGGTGASDAATARTNLGADLASNVNFTPSGTGAVQRTVSQVLDDFIRITDAGAAGDGSGDDSAEIQSVIDKVRTADRPGTILGVPGKNYRISSPLVLKRGVRLDLNGATITAAHDNSPIVKVDSDAQSHSWAVKNGILIYATQQTTAHTGGAAIQTSGGSVNSYMGEIRNMTLQNANCGIKGPSTAGSFTFLIHADNVLVVNNSGWAVDIDSGSTGGNTNLNLENIFSTQSGGSNTANKGFRIRNCGGLVAKNLNVDQARGQIAFFENTFGSISHLAFESAVLSAADGDNEGYPILLSNCAYMRIGTIYSYNSTFATGGSDMVIVRAGDSRLWVDNYILSSITQNTTGGGAVYHAQVAVSGLIRNDYFSATNASDGSAIAANLADFGTVKYITRWHGVERTTNGTWPTAADNAAAVTAGLAVGQVYQTAAGDLRIVV